MVEQSFVEIELLVDDWAAIRGALEKQGVDPDADLSWLLAFGLDRFSHDESEWQTRDGDDHTDPGRQELKRRETEALLVSMRARTIRAEMRMHDLSERVHHMGTVLKENRRRMHRLRGEIAALQGRIDRIQRVLAAPAAPGKTPPGIASRIKDWLGKRLRPWNTR